MGLVGATSSSNGSCTKSQTLSAVDQPLTDAQLIGCASRVVSKLVNGRSSMVRMVEREELKGMAREAVVLADRRYRPCEMSRRNWVITKGIYFVMDMLRGEARHTVALSMGEFRGSVRDENGDRIKPRGVVPMGEVSSIDDEDPHHQQPISYLRSASPPPETTIHNRYLHERLERALNRLPNPRDATVFRLAVWHEWTQPEIGELFGVSGSRISQILTKTCRRLQVEFADLDPNQWAA